MLKKYWLAAGVGAAALSHPGAVRAQETDAKAEAGLDAIVVTAQRRAERLQDIPMTVTVVTAKAVEQRGIRNLQDLSQAVAGVQVNFGGSFTQPSIRGITTLTTGIGFENNVAVYIDGFYQPDTNMINADFANLDSIQVLKGPQGALYGRNATGGAFLLTTKRPSDTWTGKVDLRYGNFDDKSASGFVSGPLADRVRVSLSGYGRKSDGYYDQLNAQGVKVGNAAPMHSYSARAKLEADLTDALTATLAFNYTDLSDVRGAMYTQESRRQFLPPKVGRLYDPFTFAGNHKQVQHTKVTEETLTLALDTGIGTLTSYTGYSHRKIDVAFDFDGTQSEISFTLQPNEEDTFQQNVDLKVDGIDNLDLIVGGNYYWDRTRILHSYSYNAAGLASESRQRTKAEALAAFLDATYKLGDVHLNIGGRYASELREATNISLSGAGVILFAPPTEAKRFNNFSPRASIRYEFEPDTNVYATISRGFRSGLIQIINTPAGPLINRIKPETLTSGEAGFKIARPNFRADIAAFYYDYRNLQVGLTTPNPLNPVSPINITSNAPKARVYGVEAQVTYLPVEHLELNISGAWVHARYVDFKNATGTGFVAATGVNQTQVQNWSGHQLARAPNFSAVFAVNYQFQDVVGGKLDAGLNVKYTDSYALNNTSLFGVTAGALANRQRYREGTYALVNASLNWTDASSHLTVGIWGNNLTDKKYHVSRNGSVFGDYGAWASPRTYGVRLGYGF